MERMELSISGSSRMVGGWMLSKLEWQLLKLQLISS